MRLTAVLFCEIDGRVPVGHAVWGVGGGANWGCWRGALEPGKRNIAKICRFRRPVSGSTPQRRRTKPPRH